MMNSESQSVMAIDLLWLRPGKVGGTEYYIRNLLDGFASLNEKFLFVLLVSKDNADTFRHYVKDDRFKLLEANINSGNIAKRIIWQNLFQNRFLRKHGLKRCFEPVYCKPWLNGKIDYTCVIHDLQAYHYPEYHPLHEVIYSRICWKMDMWNAAQIIAISDWVRKDIEEKYKRNDIQVIYNPIVVKENDIVDFKELKSKYNIEKNGFFYTIGQMIPHKNIETLINVMDRIVHDGYPLPDKLLITGINGSAKKDITKLIDSKGLNENVILTGYIDDLHRNTLYKFCKVFLFPSVFEGFGMPPVEAMLFGTTVITTKRTSIPEVTQGKAVYVDDPYNEGEWIEKIMKAENHSNELDFVVYQPKQIANQYLEVLVKNTRKTEKEMHKYEKR